MLGQRSNQLNYVPTVREVLQLIDLQIETLRQDSSLDPSEILAYKTRSERIRTLYKELGRIGRTRVEFKFPRAS